MCEPKHGFGEPISSAHGAGWERGSPEAEAIRKSLGIAPGLSCRWPPSCRRRLVLPEGYDPFSGSLAGLDSRNVKTPRSYTQGYNAQAVVNEFQIVVAAEVTASSPDFGHLEPMVQATKKELEAIGVTETPGVAVADSGYWNEEQMDNVIANEHVQVLIPPDAGKRDTPRPGWDGGRYTSMREALQSDYGGGLYRRRKAMVEPVFAQTKHNRRINQFQRRGRSAARSEWRLITATHNLLKLHKHQIAATAA
jgi:hypothetical protein